MSSHERFKITSFVLNTKWATSIVSPGQGTQPYPYTIDCFGYSLELDIFMSLHKVQVFILESWVLCLLDLELY